MRGRGGVVTLLRRQHCSSLCSQSEGDDFLGILRGAGLNVFRDVSVALTLGRSTVAHFARKVRGTIFGASFAALVQTFSRRVRGPHFAAQHCSSLCSQSERGDFLGVFRGAGPKRFSRRVRGPHFASKVSYSASPQSRAPRKSLLRRPSPIIKNPCPACLIHLRCNPPPSLHVKKHIFFGRLAVNA